jgi:NADH:ubiquinone oxidoreductase subunit E
MGLWWFHLRVKEAAMRQHVLLMFCSICLTCAEGGPELRDELAALRERYGRRLIVAGVDCLDACDLSPAVSVDGTLIAPASAAALRVAVERRLAP